MTSCTRCQASSGGSKDPQGAEEEEVHVHEYILEISNNYFAFRIDFISGAKPPRRRGDRPRGGGGAGGGTPLSGRVAGQLRRGGGTYHQYHLF